MNSPRGTGLMRNYVKDYGNIPNPEIHLLLESTSSKNLLSIHRDVITRYPNCSPNDENLLDTLMGNKSSATIGKIQYLITHTTVYDTLSRCTVQGEQSLTQNRRGSQ